MTTPSRHHTQHHIFEKLGGPLLTAVAEATARDDLIARGQGAKPVDISQAEEAERIASLLASTAEMALNLSRQMDLRMLEAGAADGVRLNLATLAAPLIANVYRVAGRPPNTVDIERMGSAMQAVTLFADQFQAGADATARMHNMELDFAPADGPQVQLMVLNALMPAVNAVCTFAFGQPEKNLLQDVITRLQATAKNLRGTLMPGASERDGLRGEIALLRTAANLYSQIHFTEMSKLMFMDDAARDQVDLNARLQELWRLVDTRLDMLMVLAQGLGGVSSASPVGTTAAAPAPAVPPMPTRPPSVPGNPLGGFAAAPPAAPVTPAAPPPPPANQAAPATGGSPFSAFVKPKDTAGGTA